MSKKHKTSTGALPHSAGFPGTDKVNDIYYAIKGKYCYVCAPEGVHTGLSPVMFCCGTRSLVNKKRKP